MTLAVFSFHLASRVSSTLGQLLPVVLLLVFNLPVIDICEHLLAEFTDHPVILVLLHLIFLFLFAVIQIVGAVILVIFLRWRTQAKIIFLEMALIWIKRSIGLVYWIPTIEHTQIFVSLVLIVLPE